LLLAVSKKKNKIDILTGESIQSIFRTDDFWKIQTQNKTYIADNLVMATGSNPKIWDLLAGLGHTITAPVPSLFTFNIKDARIKNLMGVSALATVAVKGTKLNASGSLLITHWGMSGPGILRLSAWGARELADRNYQFTLQVNWLNDISFEECIEKLRELKHDNAKKAIGKKSPFDFPNRLWESMVIASGIDTELRWADISGRQLDALAGQLVKAEFQVNGKSTFKDEFVTAGGINLKEVNFKTMQSKLHDSLYFAGEILDIDAITGGFNFQNAWTGGYIAAQSIANAYLSV
jgi:predicted Rossmann fold flavoprotein